MRRLKVITPAFVLITACGSGPTPQEQNLSERGRSPAQVAPASGTTAAQANLGDTMPDQPAGPNSDTVPSQ